MAGISVSDQRNAVRRRRPQAPLRPWRRNWFRGPAGRASSRQDVVRDGQHGQRAAPVAGGERVKLGRLHLDAQGAMALKLLGKILAFVIERVGGIDAADMHRHADFQRRGVGGGQQAEIGAGRKVQLAEDRARGLPQVEAACASTTSRTLT